MKIYLDGFFYQLCQYPKTATHFQNINEIPNDCDIIAISFYNNHWLQHLQTIQQLSTRTKKLLVNLSEPTPGNMSFTNFVNSIACDNVYMFSDVVFNSATTANIETAMSWFIYSDNFYASQHWAQERIKKLNRAFDRPKKFDCLLGKQRPHRDIIQSYYNNSTHRDSIVFSYHNQMLEHGLWDADIDNYQLYWGPQPQPVNSDFPSVPRDALLPLNIYNQTYYSVVAETTTENKYSFYNEKVAKPIIAGRPFVAFAGQHYLSNLRHLGFKTFESVVDQSYDAIADMRQRMTAAWAQVEWLCAQDPAHVYSELHDVLQHNHEHFLKTDWHSAIRKHF